MVTQGPFHDPTHDKGRSRPSVTTPFAAGRHMREVPNDRASSIKEALTFERDRERPLRTTGNDIQVPAADASMQPDPGEAVHGIARADERGTGQQGQCGLNASECGLYQKGVRDQMIGALPALKHPQQQGPKCLGMVGISVSSEGLTVHHGGLSEVLSEDVGGDGMITHATGPVERCADARHTHTTVPRSPFAHSHHRQQLSAAEKATHGEDLPATGQSAAEYQPRSPLIGLPYTHPLRLTASITSK